MNVENLNFNWHKTDANCDADLLQVECCGHKAKVYRAFDNQLWCSIIDGRGTRNLQSEKEAIELTEKEIKEKILCRMKKATDDINLFKAKGLVFSLTP